VLLSPYQEEGDSDSNLWVWYGAPTLFTERTFKKEMKTGFFTACVA
jgi:hypothetical protein